ncbi:MAG: diadenylate cyclase CdaA [Clostridia bacterium]|nr:diadenylate cyclase CdaA [Clostridia bacterium]
MRLADYVDIIVVAYLIYKIAKFFKDTRAVQVLKGIVVLMVCVQLSEIFKLNTINFILQNTMQVGLLAVFILFQPEIRSALARVGKSRLSFLNFDGDDRSDPVVNVINAVTASAKALSERKIGALIVIEQATKIMDIVRTGVSLDAQVSTELLNNIFYPKAPLHDGAVIIGDGKIKAASCFLPLSQNDSLESELGTRHRAGLGITEGSDCITVIVSEETGKISLACNGGLTRNLSPAVLKEALTKLLIKEEKTNKKVNLKKIVKKIKK